MKLIMISTPNCAECSASQQMLQVRGHEVEKVLVGESLPDGMVVDIEYVLGSSFGKRQVPQFLTADLTPIQGGYDGAMKYIKENS